MAQEALGMIETKGLCALLEASDSALKAADVKLVGWEKVGSGSSPDSSEEMLRLSKRPLMRAPMPRLKWVKSSVSR